MASNGQQAINGTEASPNGSQRRARTPIPNFSPNPLPQARRSPQTGGQPTAGPATAAQQNPPLLPPGIGQSATRPQEPRPSPVQSHPLEFPSPPAPPVSSLGSRLLAQLPQGSGTDTPTLNVQGRLPPPPTPTSGTGEATTGRTPGSQPREGSKPFSHEELLEETQAELRQRDEDLFGEDSDEQSPKTGEKRPRTEEQEDEEELERKAKALLEKAKAEREAAKSGQGSQLTPQQPKSELASKALARGLTPPKPKEVQYPLEPSHVSDKAKLQALLAAEPDRERRRKGKEMNAAWEAEAKALLGRTPESRKQPLAGEEALALLGQKATRRAVRSPVQSPKTNRSPTHPKPEHQPNIPDSPQKRQEYLRQLSKKVTRIEGDVGRLGSAGWQAGEELPASAFADIQSMKVYIRSLEAMTQEDLYAISPQYAFDRDALVRQLRLQVDLMECHIAIQQEDKLHGRHVRDTIPMKELFARVDKMHEAAKARQRQQEWQQENRKQRELRLARQRRQTEEQAAREQARAAARSAEKERQLQALTGTPKRKRTRQRRTPVGTGGSDDSSSESDGGRSRGQDNDPGTSPDQSPPKSWRDKPRPQLFRKAAKLPRKEASPQEEVEGEITQDQPAGPEPRVRPWMEALRSPNWDRMHPDTFSSGGQLPRTYGTCSECHWPPRWCSWAQHKHTIHKQLTNKWYEVASLC
jgi:hypothetical protein